MRSIYFFLAKLLQTKRPVREGRVFSWCHPGSQRRATAAPLPLPSLTGWPVGFYFLLDVDFFPMLQSVFAQASHAGFTPAACSLVTSRHALLDSVCYCSDYNQCTNKLKL